MAEAVSAGLGWYADPSARHEQRFFDGRRWTGHVADGDVRTVDWPVAPTPTHRAGDHSAARADPGVAPRVVERVVAPLRSSESITFDRCFKASMLFLLVLFLVATALTR